MKNRLAKASVIVVAVVASVSVSSVQASILGNFVQGVQLGREVRGFFKTEAKAKAKSAESSPTFYARFPDGQVFCEVDRFSGKKRQFVVREWDDSTFFDCVTDIEAGTLAARRCSDVKLNKHTYCLAGSDTCWDQFDINQ